MEELVRFVAALIGVLIYLAPILARLLRKQRRPEPDEPLAPQQEPGRARPRLFEDDFDDEDFDDEDEEELEEANFDVFEPAPARRPPPQPRNAWPTAAPPPAAERAPRESRREDSLERRAEATEQRLEAWAHRAEARAGRANEAAAQRLAARAQLAEQRAADALEALLRRGEARARQAVPAQRADITAPKTALSTTLPPPTRTQTQRVILEAAILQFGLATERPKPRWTTRP